MTVDPFLILTKRFRVGSLISFALLIAYVVFSFFLFFQWIAPSLDGRLDQRIAADSATYLYFADSLRQGSPDPFVIAALSSFPNTLWAPVLFALVLKSTLAMVVANYVMLFLALLLLKRSFSLSAGVFVGLLLLNATTTISLLSVNKEIVDLLAVSIFFFARRRHTNSVLLLALLLALFNRFEVCIVMLFFLLAESRLNPWRRRRFVTVIVLILGLSVTLPLLASKALSARSEETTTGHAMVWLNILEMRYLYGIAVIPKIVYNLFIELVNVFQIEAIRLNTDIANSYIVLSNNLANLIVFGILAWKHKLTVHSDIVYFALIGCIIMAVSMVLQPRYFYFAYVLLCLEAARTEASEPVGGISHHKRGDGGRDPSLPYHEEAAFG